MQENWPFKSLTYKDGLKLKELYLEGNSALEIGRGLSNPISTPTVLKVLRFLGVQIRKQKNLSGIRTRETHPEWPFTRIPETLSPKIVAMRKEGKTAKEIGESFDPRLSVNAVMNILQYEGFEKRKAKENKDQRGVVIHDYPRWPYFSVSPIEALSIVDTYTKGVSATVLGRDWGLSRQSVVSILLGYGVKTRPQEESLETSGVFINRDAFSDTNDPECAYWFGWLLSDGYIANQYGKTKRVGLSLARKDRDVVENFCKYLGLPESRVRDKTNAGFGNKALGASEVYLSHHLVSERLSRTGIEENKTFREKVPECFKFNRHFWRGFFEGDGCISDPLSSRRRLSVSIIGTKDVCEDWKRFADSLDHSISSSVYKTKTPSGKTIYTTYNGGREPTKILMDTLYQDVPEHLRLKRKYERYLGWFYPELLKDKTE